MVEECTGFTKGRFPLTYLGCPITHARKRKSHYDEPIKRVKCKITGLERQHASYGGNEVLISSVCVPIHVLSSIVPRTCVLKDLHRIFAKVLLE